MNLIFENKLKEFVIIYLNNILIYLKSKVNYYKYIN